MTTPARAMIGAVPRTYSTVWKPYVYRGTGEDVLTPELGTDGGQPPRVYEPCWCGDDMRGYRKHLRLGEQPCQQSRDDVNEYTRERNRLRRLARAS